MPPTDYTVGQDSTIPKTKVTHVGFSMTFVLFPLANMQQNRLSQVPTFQRELTIGTNLTWRKLKLKSIDPNGHNREYPVCD
ncbi:hypothetical protein PoB_004268300 [Plakobranchus ocellatus]|uniref:Uncharacterized protein n=1 Tax=Plakobranchus ocellatus TaxID=259542 RepID=A0AAV4B9A4_9GAST|nr:hypothetical protein PoB_004268300 [Plakobranchus ocellatus]